MSTPTGGNGSGTQTAPAKPAKPKNKRQAGGFALVTVDPVNEDGHRELTILVDDLAGQKEARAALVELIENGDVDADGQNRFAIIQIKDYEIVPKSETIQKVTL